MKKAGIITGIIAAIALVACVVPLKTASYTVMVDYEDTETYYEDEPYEVTEIYYEYEPWDELPEPGEESIDFPTLDNLDILEAFERVSNLRPKDYEVIRAFSDQNTAYVTLRNTDTVGATFIITFSFSGTPGTSVDREMYLEPGEQGQFIASPPYNPTGELVWSYSVWPGIEWPSSSTSSEGGLERTRREAAEWLAYFEELEYRAEHPKGQLVEKERTVTKYRQVEKQRTVISQSPETHYKKVTLLDYLLHYK